MNRFTIPRDTFYGDDALEQLKNVKGNKAMIVIGSNRLVEDNTVDKVQQYLQEANISSTIYKGIKHDPSTDMIKKGVDKINKDDYDLIIGIGGGSVIDAAKAIWIFYEHPELTFEQATVPFGLPEMRQKAKFIAIPTTSGTASEVTCLSVITDSNTNIKYPIADFNITPDIAILDTTLVESMPKNIIANTGMDALSHAIEAYVSNISTPITDALAMKSIQMIDENLLHSYYGDDKSRKQMHIAQCLAGMSFSNAVLGLVHSMSHKTGKIFNLPHGYLNAIYLPYVIQFNAKICEDKYTDICHKTKLYNRYSDQLKSSSQFELSSVLVRYCEDIAEKMNIPSSLQRAGVDKKLFNDNLDKISKAALTDPCTGTNPRKISLDEMKQLFKCAYNNGYVNF